MVNQRVLAAARLLIKSGVSVIPIKAIDRGNPNDQGKEPLIRWKEYETRLASEYDLLKWFDVSVPRGLAIVGGTVSGNLEIVDFDEEDLYDRFVAILPDEVRAIVETLPLTTTPSGCTHMLYRCEEPVGGPLRLAHSLNEDGQVAKHKGIETKAEGGYVVCPPSPACVHPAGRPYEMKRPSLTNIPVISAATRQVILDTCRSFDQRQVVKPEVRPRPEVVYGGALRPGDDYNRQRGLIQQEFEKHGWTLDSYTAEGGSEWRHPRATAKRSGGFDPNDGFICFSTNVPCFEPNVGYSPFEAYVRLNYGDGSPESRSKATSVLGKLGYGSPPINPSVAKNGLNGHHKNGSEPVSSTVAAGSWPSPTPLNAMPLLPFPLDALPDVARYYIESIHNTTKVPIDLIAMSMLGAFSAAIRGRAYVQIGGTHKEAMALFILPTMPPGGRKSAVLEHLTKPLLEYQIKLENETKVENKIAVSKRKHSADKIKRKEAELRRPGLSQVDINSIECEIARLESVAPKIRPVQQLIADDITPEKLAVNMGRAEGTAMFVASAEGRFFDHLSGIYNNGKPNMAIALKGYDGEYLVINRKGDVTGKEEDDGSDPGEVKLYRPILNFVTIVQPEVLRQMLGIPLFRRLGFIGRCMFCHYPQPIITKYENIPIDSFAYSDYEAVISQLLGMQLIATEEDPRKRIEIRIDGPALDVWAEFHDRLNDMRIDELITFDEWGAKHAGRAAKIAGVLHLVKHAVEYNNATSTPISSFEDMASDDTISEETMRQAVAIAEYAIPQTLAALGMTTVSVDTKGTKVLNAIRRINKLQIQTGEVVEKIPGETADTLAETLFYLCKCAYIRPVAGMSGCYEVNPVVFVEKKEIAR